MNRVITRSGFCPTLNRNYSVSVEQVDASVVTESKPTYIDGKVTCEYASQHDCPNTKHCPVARVAN